MIAVLVGGCADALLPAGAICEDTSDCVGGLECLPVAVHDGAECEEVGLACSLSCSDDSGCEDLGGDFVCFALCDDTNACGQFAPQ